jgi:ankyrin repeat protein
MGRALPQGLIRGKDREVVMNTERAFQDAVRQGQAALVREILAVDPSLVRVPHADGSLPLAVAARLGFVEVMRILLAAGAAPDTAEGAPSPLMEAAGAGQEAAVSLLLERGADPALRDRDGLSAVEYAQRNGHAGLASRLMPEIRAEKVLR